MGIRRVLAEGIAAVQLCAALAMAAQGVAAAETAPGGCGTWTKSTVASGYGLLENLAFDGRGSLLLSETSLTGTGGGVQRLGADGKHSAAAQVDSPGGIVVSGNTAYINTGNSTKAGLTDSTDGTVVALDLTTGALSTVATGLRMPNGLALLPDGGFVVSKDLGATTTLTAVAPDRTTRVLAPGLTSTNGLAYDPVRRKLFVSTTFDMNTTIAAVSIDHPNADPVRYTLPGFGPLNSADDLTVGPDGAVYVALNLAGRIVRLDPDTSATCTIADNLPLSSSVRFGSGPGWDPKSAYVTSFLGTVTRLTPQ
ncbi:SMP-30/gluconolactonase/LRE family protein [Nocardia inohanensis]|uniref:SMP-30/gluconolactonase/LRE family protein n=1 Tax=Nocardia inohanensis TaxID=209246 RepID=UPI00083390EE|nr:SMP-30/gluconolactonase/LRE family protein [Nocardia inohanensis]